MEQLQLVAADENVKTSVGTMYSNHH